MGGLAAFAEASAGLRLEERWFERALSSPRQQAEIHFWTLPQCLVTSTTLARKAGFDVARRRSEAKGWPVLARRSGGGTVFHGHDVLCVTLIERVAPEDAGIERIYERFCSVLREGLRSLGVETQLGSLASAPCDGRFNLLISGRKLAGTAARMALRSDGVAALSHACILVGKFRREALDALSAFERDLGLPAAYRAESLIGLADCDADASIEVTAAAIRTAFDRGTGGARTAIRQFRHEHEEQ